MPGEPSKRAQARQRAAERKAAKAESLPAPAARGLVSPTLERMLLTLRHDHDPELPHQAPSQLTILRREPLVTHRIAKCRWCGGRFRLIDSRFWICMNEECAERQMTHAVRQREQSATAPVLFLPLPIQVDWKVSPIVHLLVAGAAGISKSYGGRWLLYSRCRKIGGYRALLLRNTYDELEKNHLQFMTREAELLGSASFKVIRSTRVFTFHDNDSRIYVGYCDVVADIAQHVGPEWDEILFEEGVTFLPKALNEISARARGSESSRLSRQGQGISGGRTRILSNPGGRGMLYLIDHYIERNPDREEYPTYDPSKYGYFTGTLEDNPYLEEDYAANSLSGLSAARYKQLRHGDWSIMAGQFFESFDADVHVRAMEAS